MLRDINRYQTKLAYQRNMTIAHLIVATFVVGSVLIFDQILNTSEPVSRVTITNVRGIDDAIKTKPDTPETRRSLAARPQSPNRFQGQFGVRLKIIADNLELPSINRPEPELYSLAPNDAPIIDAFSVSDIETGESGAYFPENAIYVYHPPVDSTPLLLTRGPRVVYREKPNTPPSAVMMGMGGEVEVLMLIAPDGRPATFAIKEDDSGFETVEYLLDVILNDGSNAKLEFYIDPDENGLRFITIKDEPSDFKFSQYLYEVLPNWQFIPAFENGEAVYCFVHLHYGFCAPGDQDCIELILTI